MSPTVDASAPDMPAAESDTAGPQDIDLLDETLALNLDATAERFPSAVALDERSTGRRWTYTQLAEASRGVAKALIAAGYERGDRLGRWSPNVAEWATLLYGAARAGVILVELNPAYRAHELTPVVEQCVMRGLVVACPDARTDPPQIARQVARAGAPALRQLVLLPADADAVPVGGPATDGPEGDGPGGDAVVAGRPGEPATETAWAAFLAAGAGVSDEELTAREAAAGPDDPVTLQYTSGTTGFPKGVTLTHRNVLNNGFHIGRPLRCTEEDGVVIPVPFFHCFGMVIGLIAAVSHGAASILPSRSFDPAAALRSVTESGERRPSDGPCPTWR